MKAQANMTVLEMYAELVRLGLQSSKQSQLYFFPPTHYQYVPTELVYSYPAQQQNAQLERDIKRSPNPNPEWK
jgi:hypothetical protein